MSGNESESGDTSTESTRLRDRATSAFQRRRQQAGQVREQLAQQRDRFAETLGISGDQVRPVQFGDRDADVGFVPTEEGREELATDFAADRPFVEPSDALVDADPQRGTLTRTDPADLDNIASRAQQEVAGDTQFVEPGDLDVDVGAGGVTGLAIRADRRDDVEQRAVTSTASDSQFITPGDLDAEVGDMGVSDIFVADDRRDDIASRVREDIAGDSRFVNPGDVAVEVGRSGVESAGLSEAGEDRVERRQAAARRRAQRRARSEARQETARELDQRFEQVDIGTGDISISGGQATLDRDVQEQIAAERFDDQLDGIDTGTFSITPALVERSDDGFRLSDRGAEFVGRFRAAEELDEQLSDNNIGFVDVTRTGDDTFGLSDVAREEIAAAEIDEQFPGVDIGLREVSPRDDGSFGLSDIGRRSVAAEDISEQIGVDVSPGDVTATGDGEFRLTDDFTEELQ